MEPGRSDFKHHEIFYLDDVECRRNVWRRIDDLAFMKKARLHRMRGSPTPYLRLASTSPLPS